MQPHAVLLADIRDVVDGIEGTQHRGPGSGAHEEGDVALRATVNYQPLQLLWYHTANLVRRDHHAVVCAQTAHRRT